MTNGTLVIARVAKNDYYILLDFLVFFFLFRSFALVLKL